ncbi:hypothetical protein J6590_042339 [Homalodisca vitripennis]|nr:hypothetical protein J6590_042339 [Homalodisca vitripennis]
MTSGEAVSMKWPWRGGHMGVEGRAAECSTPLGSLTPLSFAVARRVPRRFHVRAGRCRRFIFSFGVETESFQSNVVSSGPHRWNNGLCKVLCEFSEKCAPRRTSGNEYKCESPDRGNGMRHSYASPIQPFLEMTTSGRMSAL